MGNRKKTTKRIPPRKQLPVPVEDKHKLLTNLNDTDKSNEANTPVPEKCSICARINSSVATLFDEVSTFQILCQLFKILKISPAVCRFLLADSLSTERVQFCESCDKTITRCLKVSQEIDNLRNVLEESTIKLKEDIIEGYYCRPDPDPYPDSSQRTNSNIRKTLVQCWATCQVTIKKLPPSSYESYHNVKTTKRSKPALWSVKQEVCDDNEMDFNEGPNSPSPNETVKPQTQKDVVETECNTADNDLDFDSDDIESPCSPIASWLSSGSNPEKIDDPDPDKKDVISESPRSPSPSPLLWIDQKIDAETIGDPSKIDTLSDVKDEQKSSLTSQRTLRPRPKNKILADNEIERDENESDTGSFYSPESPFNDEEQKDSKVRTTKEHHIRFPSSLLKFRKRQTKMKPRGKTSPKPKPKTRRSTDNIRKKLAAQSTSPSLNENCQEFPFSCKNCNRGFTLRQMLENHKCPLDFNYSKYPCEICNAASFSTLPTLRKHQIIKHNRRKSKTLQNLENKSEKLESFLCTYCDKNYERKDFRVSPDTETETGGDLLSIQCDLPNCEKHFSNFYRFSIHHSRTCVEKARLIAENPENNRGLQGYVRTYADSKTTDNGTTETEETFSTAASNTQNTTFLSCKICGMSFQRRKGLYLHEMRHAGQKITCPECPENFKSIVSVRLHQVRVHGQPTKSTYDAENGLDTFECVWCKESFLRSSYLVPGPEAEAKNSDGNDSGDRTYPSNKILRIDVHSTEATPKKTLSDFKEFQWHHRHHCPSRPMIQLGSGYMERRNKILTRRFRSPTTSTQFPFSCSICGKGYQKLIPYNAHLAFHRREFNYPCTICKDKFVSAELLNRHTAYHHGTTPNSYFCTPCDKRIDLNFEVAPESGESKAACVFDNCSSSSFNVKCHQSHHRTHHSDLKSRHYCGFCEKTFFSDEFSERTYSGDLKFKCSFTDKCEKLYDNFQSWSHHHIYHHRYLEKSLKQRQSPKKQELHFCQFCQKGFATQSSCRAHQTTAHTKNFEFYCEICGLGRPNADKLQQHMLCHSEDRPFACELCPSAYKTKIHLKFHMNKHNDVRPYVCEVCGKAFHSSNHLNMHRKIHKR